FAVDGDSERRCASLNKPGGNVTGVNFFTTVLGPKRLELFRQLVPKATTFGMLVNPNNPDTEAERRDVQASAQAIGQQLIVIDVSSDRDIEAAFATFVRRGAGALFVGGGAFLFSNRERVVALAARYAPSTLTVGFLENPNNPVFELTTRDVLAAAPAIGLKVQVLKAGTDREIDAAFMSLVQSRTGALLVGGDLFFNNRIERLIELAARHAIPTMYTFREFVVAGGGHHYRPRPIERKPTSWTLTRWH